MPRVFIDLFVVLALAFSLVGIEAAPVSRVTTGEAVFSTVPLGDVAGYAELTAGILSDDFPACC